MARTVELARRAKKRKRENGEPVNTRVTKTAKRRICYAAEVKAAEAEIGHVTEGEIITDLAMKHLPPAPEERAAIKAAAGILRAAS